MKRKIHKILLLTSIVTVGMLFLCSCSKKTPDEKLTDSFLEYSLGKTDGKFNRVFTTSNGTEMVISALTKEDTHYPKVLLSVEIGNTDFKNQIYQWITSPVSMRMDDYRECAEMVIKYAKNENWNNNYYLYVKFYISFSIIRINTIHSSILRYRKTLILPRIYHD